MYIITKNENTMIVSLLYYKKRKKKGGKKDISTVSITHITMTFF